MNTIVVWIKSSFLLLALAVAAAFPRFAQAGGYPSFETYAVTNLIADTPGAAANTDTNLLNPWGLIFDPSGTLDIVENGPGQTEFFLSDGTPLGFSINTPGNPTGIEYNSSTNEFIIGAGTSNASPAALLLATESGTILGFSLGNSPNTAVVAVDRSASKSVYKGLATAKVFGRQFLYAADFYNARIDGFDSDFNYVGSFTDPRLPAGFAPFNIQNIDGLLFVTFAKQLLPAKHDDQPGPGNGFVDVFAPEGILVRRLVEHGRLNSPWGLALAPANFGPFSFSLLVGNFGDGTINSYDPITGRFLGQLAASGKPIVLPGLWSLTFAPDSGSNWFESEAAPATLYFSSGPNAGADGLVGAITAVSHPKPPVHWLSTVVK